MFGLTRWAPFGSAFRLHREIDDLFSRFLGEAGDEPRGVGESERAWLPAIETYSREGTMGVRVALPGVDPKDVEVSVTDNLLTIKGERKLETETKDGNYFQRELAYGAFQRTLILPDGVDVGNVQAKYSNGMLEVTMPAPLSVAPKRVDIQVEAGQGQPKAIKAA
jgi:HSP20 family protein